MTARPLPLDPASRSGPTRDRLPTRPSLYRRLLGGAGGSGDAPGEDSQTELAERLDTMLHIAERLAATHDRRELFRTIVDETRRALRVDHVTIRVVEDDRLVVAAWAGLSDRVARALPVFGVDEGWAGEVVGTGETGGWAEAGEDRWLGGERVGGIAGFGG